MLYDAILFLLNRRWRSACCLTRPIVRLAARVAAPQIHGVVERQARLELIEIVIEQL